MTGSIAVVMVIIMVMAVMVMMRLVGAAVGTAFGREWFDYHFNICAQQLEHVFYNVVTPDQYPGVFDLRFQMPVAQVPGQHQHVVHVPRTHGHELFGLRSHPEDAPIVQHQSVPMRQLDRLWQIEQEGHPFVTGQGNAAPMALVLGERNASVRRRVHVRYRNVV